MKVPDITFHLKKGGSMELCEPIKNVIEREVIMVKEKVLLLEYFPLEI